MVVLVGGGGDGRVFSQTSLPKSVTENTHTSFELQQDGVAIMATQNKEGSLMNFAQTLRAPGPDSSGRQGEEGGGRGGWVGTGAGCQFRKA